MSCFGDNGGSVELFKSPTGPGTLLLEGRGKHFSLGRRHFVGCLSAPTEENQESGGALGGAAFPILLFFSC